MNVVVWLTLSIENNAKRPYKHAKTAEKINTNPYPPPSPPRSNSSVAKNNSILHPGAADAALIYPQPRSKKSKKKVRLVNDFLHELRASKAHPATKAHQKRIQHEKPKISQPRYSPAVTPTPGPTPRPPVKPDNPLPARSFSTPAEEAINTAE
jgi:hypothetical protein